MINETANLVLTVCDVFPVPRVLVWYAGVKVLLEARWFDKNFQASRTFAIAAMDGGTGF